MRWTQLVRGLSREALHRNSVQRLVSMVLRRGALVVSYNTCRLHTSATVWSGSRENGLERRTQGCNTFCADRHIPQGLEALPAASVRRVTKRATQVRLGTGATEDIAPRVELAVRIPVTLFKLGRCQPSWSEDDVSGVEAIPV